MEIAKSAACDDGDHGECEAGWCACWCHETGHCCDDDHVEE